MTYQSLELTHDRIFSINKCWATLDWISGHNHVLSDGNGVISDYNSNFHLLSVNPLYKVTFIGLHVVTMLGNIVTTFSE